ncbi:AAA family ATPase [Actinomadura sp. LOL_016]|uniref:AAA family ATPase n=1 Tax=unclassified Actinomadura TaxID=2626254 RepID=UPI003A810008
MLVVMLNGAPGSGKTTLARPLAQTLRLPLFSKDLIKETHADVLGAHHPGGGDQRDWSRRLGAAASDSMWALLRTASGGATLESFWPASTRPFVCAGLDRAEAGVPLEIWCDVPAATARARFIERLPQQHPVHGDPATTGWDDAWAAAEPLALGPVLRVDTAAPADIGAVADWVRTHAPQLCEQTPEEFAL